MHSLTHRLAQHAIETRFDPIPNANLEAAKLLTLDTLAVAWAGADAPGCEDTHAMLKHEGGREDATAWAYGSRLPATAAAFINGMTAAAIEYDSIGLGVAVHSYIAELPAALAIAEREHATGREFLTALVLGCDITHRFGAAAAYPNRGFHYTATMGCFGAAAAAARLLKLDVEQTQHALGLAFLQAGGTQQANIQPSLAKRMLSAFAARAGVYAALLAQRGVTAPPDVIEGQFGFYKLYQPGDADKLTHELGKRFDNDQASIKLYPSCGCNHTAIDATLALAKQYDLKPGDVTAIEATITPYIQRIVGGEYDPSGDAQVAAQFNLKYSIACALVRRRLGLAEIQPDAARDPNIAAHMGKITLKVDDTQTGTRGPVELRMQTRTHGQVSCRVEDVAGSDGRLIAPEQVQDKFRECFAMGRYALSDARYTALKQRVEACRQIGDMAQLFAGD
ncbi:MAG: MmgE/PrpD family protein [Betaproteobacteria bacterium]|nr:MmgE/PrpD family protein [Betaproteobacteria bacterium]